MSEYEIKEEETTADLALIARREARRRKILENSKLRLEKLNGRISNESNNENKPLNNSHRTFSDPEMETEEMFVVNSSNNPFMNYNDFPSMLVGNGNTLFQNQENRNIEDNMNISNQNKNVEQDINNIFNQKEAQNSTVNKQQSLTDKILKSKFHLIILSTFTYGFVVFGNEYFSNYSIFLPLLIWELTETIIIRPKQNSPDALLNLFLLLVGIPLHLWEPLLKIVNTLNKVFKDVGVFVFSFVICHVIYKQIAIENMEHRDVIEEHSFT